MTVRRGPEQKAWFAPETLMGSTLATKAVPWDTGQGLRGPGCGVRDGGGGTQPWSQLSQAGPVSAPLPTVITTLILQHGAF